ncbi:uncharacterized protein K02A2.6-like isoform X1 [Plodia interpunctella]|uniref:uncharacterized protein K02A2.6-like isoform X1 n=1 Tax=Plodia interpunctella TaxID=58824 RepID=UPI002367E5BF|nr:uncharacterized protein K02A2.6-like isoform X1 [Plodia interpunctella]XP_053601233.1 uncharacterized protein K02A2.6-like isoform X1 [Plodia interpunctella]
MTQSTSTLSLPNLDNFDCNGDPASVGLRWQKWKRALEIYFLAANIEKPGKKRATLLHIGGLSLQEVYYNLPGAHVDDKTDVDVYAIAIDKLNSYFAPKQSRIYERYIFRLMKQEENENFERFLLKLREQAEKCQFKDKDEHLIDQITEKCRSMELRKKILEIGDSVTLDQVISKANALEVVARQLDQFKNIENPQFDKVEVNKIIAKKVNSKLSYGTRSSDSDCSRCGSKRHSSNDTNCPAKDKRCLKCGFIGHYKEQCRTAKKRRFTNNKSETVTKKPKLDSKKVDGRSEIDYIFHLDEDETIQCTIGGICVAMLIDSGSKCNVITDKTWQYLKNNKVQVSNMNKKPDKILVPYGSKDPLEIIGAFDANISTNSKCITSTLYVIKNGTRDLLGKSTAIQLGVLRIGLQINAVQANLTSEVVFPKFKGVTVQIPIDKNIKPVIQPYRRVPIPLEERVDKKLQELKDADIIEEVNEPTKWVSPMVPVLKENGEVRICVDMRRANEAIIRENHPLPTMNQLLPNFRKAQYFSKLDIKNAFHQLEIEDDCRYITTFSTSKGLFRYKRLMFGISCAPEMFQKILEKLLLGCDGTFNFIDDIIIYGSTELEHDQRLRKVLQVLKDKDVLLNENKCIFKTQKIEFLGHELSANGVKPLKKYLTAIQSSREPNTTAEIQSFLGLVNFVGKWIPNLATLTEPLRALLRLGLGKNANIERHWTSEQVKAFKSLKYSLSNIHSLGYYDASDRTQVIADASPVGLGAVLVQIGENGPRVIAYGHKSLTNCEKRYCQTEKEALALVWAVEHFKIYLFGKDFELISDHKPLETIFGRTSKPCARIERWVLRLQGYRYKIIYRPGRSNIADTISRLCNSTEAQPFDSENYINQIIDYSRPVAIPLNKIKESSATDDEILKVRNGISSNIWHESIGNYKIIQSELCFNDEILLRGTRIVIPNNLRQKVLEAAHEGHPGIVAMKARLRTKVWWPRIDKDVECVVKSCRGCTLVSNPTPPHPMKRRVLPDEPWVDVAVDFLGPLPSRDYLLILVDYYSRYKEIKVMRSITTGDTIKVLKEIFSRLGYPATLTCDNGSQFSSEEFKNYCIECGIIIYNTIPYWPQMNGEVERQNRDVLKRLKISQAEEKNWKEEIFRYLMMYNSTPHSVTGKSPSELFFKRQFRDKIPTAPDIEYRTRDTEIRDRDAEMKEKGKDYSDRKRKAAENSLEIGEKVLVKNIIKENKLTTNFSPVEHCVTNVNGGDVTVRNEETGKEYRRNIVHLKKVNDTWTVVDQNSNNEVVNK